MEALFAKRACAIMICSRINNSSICRCIFPLVGFGGGLSKFCVAVTPGVGRGGGGGGRGGGGGGGMLLV